MRRKTLIVVVLISLLGGILRWHNYAQFPAHYRTGDEKAWSWLGSSLIVDHQPTSWSLFKSYQPDYVFQDRDSGPPLVRPSLDHPPHFLLSYQVLFIS